MMMKAIPRVTLIGQPTRGASGNPHPVQLSNGIQVMFSRWVSMLPDGSPIETIGVPPDRVVPHQRANDEDPTLEVAIKVLQGAA